MKPTSTHTGCIGCTAEANPHGTLDGSAVAAVAACRLFGPKHVLLKLCDRHARMVRAYLVAMGARPLN